jgi:transcriptional antiterminator NusG
MDFKWYTLATYSGSEIKVSEEINRMANENENIKEAFVPMKKVFKVMRGKKVEYSQKVFPNYIFVKIIANRSTIDLIRTMPQVMGFLGSNPLKPESIPDDNIKKMKQDAEKDVVVEEEKFEIGETVR